MDAKHFLLNNLTREGIESQDIRKTAWKLQWNYASADRLHIIIYMEPMDTY